MYWWIVGLAANAVIAVASVGVVAFILWPLLRNRQLTKNKLGAATAAVFVICAVHHALHVLQLALPDAGFSLGEGVAVRESWSWPLALWDVLAAAVFLHYLHIRRTYGPLMQGAQLFDDLRRRERQALEINDNVLQGMVVAKMALELEQQETAVAALDTSIAAASRMISSLLATEERPVAAGLLRTRAAVLEPAVPEPAARDDSRVGTA